MHLLMLHRQLLLWACLISLLAHACHFRFLFASRSLPSPLPLSRCLLIHFNYAIAGSICHRHLLRFSTFAYRMPYIVYVYRTCTCQASLLLSHSPTPSLWRSDDRLIAVSSSSSPYNHHNCLQKGCKPKDLAETETKQEEEKVKRPCDHHHRQRRLRNVS